MDLSSLLPLINMLSQYNKQEPVAKVNEVLSDEDREYIKQNTTMFPASFVPPNDFPKQPLSQQKPIQQHSQMDLKNVLPLLNTMTGNNLNMEQIGKLMNGFNGGGDIGGLINLISGFAKNNKVKQTQKKQIISDKNDDYISAD